uniref:Cyclin-like domain-containing protein n=1 Tax=Prasinoderma singulare TaxID=676789 RepID=A0A7S3BGW5_9VIRI
MHELTCTEELPAGGEGSPLPTPAATDEDCDWGQLTWEKAQDRLGDELCSQVATERRVLCQPVAAPTMPAPLREKCVAYMLGAQARFGFRSASVGAAITFMDRYMQHVKMGKGREQWMSDLLAVTCLSLAIKMEEVMVPTLTDLQVNAFSPPYPRFEAGSVKRMELNVCSTLKWNLVVVTPFEYVDRMLWFANIDGPPQGGADVPTREVSAEDAREVRTLAYDLLRQQLSVTAPLRFAPSVRAAAAVTAATSTVLGPAWGDAVLQALAEVIDVPAEEGEAAVDSAQGATNAQADADAAAAVRAEGASAGSGVFSPITPRTSSEGGLLRWPVARESHASAEDTELLAAMENGLLAPSSCLASPVATARSGRCTPSSAKEDEICECQKISRNATPDSILDAWAVLTPGVGRSGGAGGKRAREWSAEPPTPDHVRRHDGSFGGLRFDGGRYALRERHAKVARSF